MPAFLTGPGKHDVFYTTQYNTFYAVLLRQTLYMYVDLGHQQVACQFISFSPPATLFQLHSMWPTLGPAIF